MLANEQVDQVDAVTRSTL